MKKQYWMDDTTDICFISENKGRLGEFIMDFFLGHNEDNFF